MTPYMKLFSLTMLPLPIKFTERYLVSGAGWGEFYGSFCCFNCLNIIGVSSVMCFSGGTVVEKKYTKGMLSFTGYKIVIDKFQLSL